MADNGQAEDGQEPPVWFMDQLDSLIRRHHASYQEWLSRREQEATLVGRRPRRDRRAGAIDPTPFDLEL